MQERIPKNWKDYIKYSQSIARASSGRRVKIEIPDYIKQMMSANQKTKM